MFGDIGTYIDYLDSTSFFLFLCNIDEVTNTFSLITASCSPVVQLQEDTDNTGLLSAVARFLARQGRKICMVVYLASNFILGSSTSRVVL